ncbi:MAG: MFS transporter [Ferrovibrionaceae bacterium]
MTAQRQPGDWRIILYSSLGSGLDFYDFAIFAVFAGVIGPVFFPAGDDLASLLQTYLLFAVSYLVRPIGGIVFGHLGDRFGRRRAMLLSLWLGAFAAFGIAALPGHAELGAAATVGFIALRILQGLTIGGQIPGTITFVSEFLPLRRGLACGLVFMLIELGLLLGNAVSLGLHAALTPDAVAAWGWRIAYALAGLFGFASYLLQHRLEETPAFAAATAARLPLAEVVRGHGPALLTGMALTALPAALLGVVYLQMPAWLIHIVGTDPQVATAATSLGVLVWALGIGLAGWIGDRGLRPAELALAAVITLVLSWPFYRWLATGIDPVVPLLLAAIPSALMFGAFPAMLTALFPAALRFSGIALAYNLAFALFGGVGPLVATWAVQASGVAAAPAWYLMASAVVGLAGLWGLRILHLHSRP